MLDIWLRTLAACDCAVDYRYDFYPPSVIFLTLNVGIQAVTIARQGLTRQYRLAAEVAKEVAESLAAIGMYADEAGRAA